jgi:hypothetical protein
MAYIVKKSKIYIKFGIFSHMGKETWVGAGARTGAE